MRSRGVVVLVSALLGYSLLDAADRNVEPIVSRIHREAVESSAIRTVGYSRHLHALEIEFHDGLIYRYEEVPIPLFHGLVSSESKARFYNKNIRGKYHCVRVRPARAQ
ncbi:MAG: KTSC domain-containing protein [Verrucomicrobiota bacterium]|nr:KTSC domain-containing protein [Verrucomicrobiota bacterium]